MSGKPTRLIVIIAATLALAACQQQSGQSEQAPASVQPAPMGAPNTSDTNTSQTNTGETEAKAAASAMTAKPAKPEPRTEPTGPAMTPSPSQPVAMKQAATKPTTMEAKSPATEAPVPATTAPEPAKPAASAAMTAKPEASPPKPEAMPTAAESFNTLKCKACHSIDRDKVGPAWKTVAEKYGDAATLARDFESGFKERRVANSIAKWKSKESLMTSQFNHLIKGHEKAAAHALFESVKNGKFGNY